MPHVNARNCLRVATSINSLLGRALHFISNFVNIHSQVHTKRAVEKLLSAQIFGCSCFDAFSNMRPRICAPHKCQLLNRNRTTYSCNSQASRQLIKENAKYRPMYEYKIISFGVFFDGGISLSVRI